MKYLIFIVTVMLSQSTLGNESMSVEQLFETELKEKNVSYEKEERFLYRVETSDGKRDISIFNLHQNYLRDRDPEAIKRFVKNILQPITGDLSWSQLKEGIYPSLEPSDYRFVDEVIHKRLADTSIVVMAYFNSELNQIRFISDKDLKNIGIGVQAAWAQAYRNIDSIMDVTDVSFKDIDGQLLGMVEANEPYKASLILSNRLKVKIEKEIGWPVYAVAPARDFVYLFSKEGGLVSKVGAVVVREFKNSGYPISTDVWELSDSKQTAIGAYPTE
ncbi:hypothetical protein [uncultured Pseudoteredinibacter sp.]|uniref:hypothetical protein n=1 Tax=uncultured Pseudoteredinibacter sp. TaxID=1641701 RepID=UPI002602A86F|nr:hypothetical protein [uncultured Pseudoteredinibacter sp.]